MTASSGGSHPDNEGRSPSSSVLERPVAAAEGARPADRALGRIFPPTADSTRDALMRQTWNAFCSEMMEAVEAAVDRDRSPPEIAYAVGEVVHNYFRARGATLTSYELRHLVSELLDRHSISRPEALKQDAVRGNEPKEIVAFAREPSTTPWQGEEPAEPRPEVTEKAFEPPASVLVEVLDREGASFKRWLAGVVGSAGSRLAPRAERAAARAIVAAAVDRVLRDESEPVSTQTRKRLEENALSELCGLGVIDRLWADRTIHAVFVNGPAAIYVERNGVVERAEESFRDESHLIEVLGRLAPRAERSVVNFRLRDGGSGVLVFPPAAPRGPVLALRRADPGAASFERLIAAGVLTRPMADLLRIAARCRLNVLVSGPAGSGKTALLAALARDMGEARIVTVARHRFFRSAAPSRIELVAQGDEAAYPALLAAGSSLRPDLFVVDSVRLEDVPALVEHLSRGARGTVAAIEPASLPEGVGRSADLFIRLARGSDGLHRVVSMQDAAGSPVFVYEEGRFQRRTSEPAFADVVRAAGLGEALTATLR